MSPVELSPASQTASTSSTLWAQPSKEWVIPAKPKPGRKPKETNAGPTILKDDPDDDMSGSRRMQNRAAQRAFRERKQTQLAELQARLHSYEQGEIERNVALQNIAKKMKEENDELRKENQILREKVARLEQERDEFLDKDKKRAYDDTTSSPSFLTDTSATKRARVDEDKQEAPSNTHASSFPSSSSSMVSSPDDTTRVGEFFPGGSESRNLIFPTPPPISSLLTFTVNEATSSLDNQDIAESFNCILCTPDAPCVCREMSIQATTDSNSALHQLPLQNEGLSDQSIISLDQSVHLDTPIASASILDNLPAFQAPVPIRRRPGIPRENPVFPVTPIVVDSPSSAAKCSGDPDNCSACADDNFGRAFCQAIGHTLNSALPCIDCPKRTNQADEILVGGCCGDISKCGSCGIAPIISSTAPSRTPETISTDDAWRQLKSHPNVAFADLTLLAEVVARRSRCTGSRVVISPVLGSATPDLSSNKLPSHHEAISTKEEQYVMLTDPHEHFRQKQRQRESPPQLVPQHVLIECGRRRMREVNADGVREAIRLLDQKFAHTR